MMMMEKESLLSIAASMHRNKRLQREEINVVAVVDMSMYLKVRMFLIVVGMSTTPAAAAADDDERYQTVLPSWTEQL